MAASLICLYLVLLNFQASHGVTPTPEPGNQQATCSALQQVADRSAICSTTSTCTQLHCAVEQLGSSADIAVLPCTSPPSVNVSVIQNGNTIYKHVFSRSEVVPISTGGVTVKLNVSLVVSPNQDSMTLEVTAIPLLGTFTGPPVTIFPKTNIPLSRSQCGPTGVPSFTLPQSPSTHSPAPSSPGPVTDHPHMQHPETCQALQKIAQNSASQCRAVDSCTAIDCSFLPGYHARLTVEPCHNPPAIGVVVHDSSGDELVNQALVGSNSQPVNYPPGTHLFDLITNVTHVLHPDSLVLKVSVHPTIGGDIDLIPATSIPIDRCSCPGVTCATDSSMGSSQPTKGGVHSTQPVSGITSSRTQAISGSASSSTQSSNVLKIVIPVAAIAGLLLMALVVVVLVVVVVVCSRKKRAGAYNFQRVTFNSGIEDEDEEGG